MRLGSPPPHLSQTYIPLATVLLAISEQSFFLNNWHHFVTQNLLPSLKVCPLLSSACVCVTEILCSPQRGDTKIHNIALVSLYRLVW